MLYKYSFYELDSQACDNHRKSICACQIALNHNTTFIQTFNQRHIHVPNTNTFLHHLPPQSIQLNWIQRLQAAWFYNTSPNQTPHFILFLPIHPIPIYLSLTTLTIICIFHKLFHFLILPKQGHSTSTTVNLVPPHAKCRSH